MFRNKILMILVFALALGAIAGMANASPIPVSCVITSINQNGNYIGEPVLSNDAPGLYSYNYVFSPDGTYTIYGTLTNMDPKNDYTVFVSYALNGGSGWILVPANSKVDFSFTDPADSYNSVLGGLWWEVMDTTFSASADTSHVDLTQAAYVSHTVDEGPMSDLSILFTSGKFDFKNSPLYSFTD